MEKRQWTCRAFSSATTLDSATEFLFGHSAGTLKGDLSGSRFADSFHYAQKSILLRGMLGSLRVLYRDRHANECYRTCRNFAKPFVDEAIRTAEETAKGIDHGSATKRIFSHELAARTTDRTVVLDEVMNVLLAGRDTTASLLGNMFFMLAKNPDVWKKLREEVAVLDGRAPNYEELRNLKYVQCCINESLRLHPVVPRNERQAIRHTVLPTGGGATGRSPVFVPKGTVVAYNVYAMHRRQDIYGPDAEVFRPERWEGQGLKPQWGYLPFNGGPRICIGQQYALTEASYVLARMAQEFERLESRDGGCWVESLALTLCSRNGTKVALMAA